MCLNKAKAWADTKLNAGLTIVFKESEELEPLSIGLASHSAHNVVDLGELSWHPQLEVLMLHAVWR